MPDIPSGRGLEAFPYKYRIDMPPTGDKTFGDAQPYISADKPLDPKKDPVQIRRGHVGDPGLGLPAGIQTGPAATDGRGVHVDESTPRAGHVRAVGSSLIGTVKLGFTGSCGRSRPHKSLRSSPSRRFTCTNPMPAPRRRRPSASTNPPEANNTTPIAG